MVDWERPPHLPQNSSGIFSLLFLTGTRFTTAVREAALQPDGDGTWTTCLSSEACAGGTASGSKPWVTSSRQLRHGTGSRVRSRQRQQSGPWLWRKGDNHEMADVSSMELEVKNENLYTSLKSVKAPRCNTSIHSLLAQPEAYVYAVFIQKKGNEYLDKCSVY